MDIHKTAVIHETDDKTPEEAVLTQLAAVMKPLDPPPSVEEGSLETPVLPPAENAAENQVSADDRDDLFVDPHQDGSPAASSHKRVVLGQNTMDLDSDPNSVCLLEDVPLPSYAWHSADSMPEEQAIRVLEEAVETAIQRGQQVANLLQEGSTLDQRVNGQQWMREFDAVCQDQEQFEVVVGVSGITGAGKTTMINALLDTNELLPSGSDGAATATVCRLHKNKDPAAEHAYKAVVSFKTKADLRRWLEPILADVQTYYAYKRECEEREKTRKQKSPKRREGREGRDEKDGNDEEEEDKNEESEYDEDEDEEEFDVETLHDKLSCVEAVFRLGLEDLEDCTTDDLLSPDKFPIMRRMGRTKTIVGNDQEAFSAQIRPYLDSTPWGADIDYDDFDKGEDNKGKEDESEDEGWNHGGDDDEDEEEREEEDEGKENKDEEEEKEEDEEEEDGEEDGEDHGEDKEDDRPLPPKVMWLLVAQVDIYLTQAPLLENSIVLADVPGLADAMEERAHVARDCFNKLNLTMVVAPTIRATDDATCIGLLSYNEAQYLRLNNRLNRRTFCVATSKTDDLDWQRYLTRDVLRRDGAAESAVAEHCRVYGLLEDECKRIAGVVHDARMCRESLLLEQQLHTYDCDHAALAKNQSEKQEMDDMLDQLALKQRDLSIWLEFYTGRLAFSASAARNNKVRLKIQDTFRRKTESVQTKCRSKGPDIHKVVREGEDLDVLPFSAKAYWTLREHEDAGRAGRGLASHAPAPLVGYPTAAFTGIPALRAWIRAATIPMRRRHATSVLKRLAVLLNQLRAGYSEDAEGAKAARIAGVTGVGEDTEIAVTAGTAGILRSSVTASISDNPAADVRKILEEFGTLLSNNLHARATTLIEQARRCNPMQLQAAKETSAALVSSENEPSDKKASSRFSAPCRDRVLRNVKDWKYRLMIKPGQGPGLGIGGGRRRRGAAADAADARPAVCYVKTIKDKNAKMAWATHAAILRRNGGPYISKGRIPGSYSWMSDMGSLVLADIVHLWEQAFQDHLPRELQAARKGLLDAWTRAMTPLCVRLPRYFSEAQQQLADLLVGLQAIRDCTVDAAERAVEDLAKQATGVQATVESILVKGWVKAFEGALRITGKGLFASRQDLLEAYARKQTTPLVKDCMKVLNQQFEHNITDLRTALDRIWDDGEAQARQLAASLLRGMAGNSGDGAVVLAPRLDARARRINALVHQWDDEWKAPDAYTHVSCAAAGGADENGIAGQFPADYLPAPVEPCLESVLPNVTEDDDDGDDDDSDALRAERSVPVKPKRVAPKRTAAQAGATTKTASKKRKTAAAVEKPKPGGSGNAQGQKAVKGGSGGRGGRGGKGKAKGKEKGKGKGKA